MSASRSTTSVRAIRRSTISASFLSRRSRSTSRSLPASAKNATPRRSSAPLRVSGASLDKTVVAEGIETEEQLKQVKMHGCHEGQGHLFGEPMPADIIQARLEASTSVAQLVA